MDSDTRRRLIEAAGNRGEAFGRADDIPVNRPCRPTLGDLAARRYGRREVLRGALATAVLAGLSGPPAATPAAAKAGRFAFAEIAHGIDETHHVAPGHDAEVLIRWGDPVLADAPPFDPARQTAAAQERQFGYNNDFLAYLPLPAGSDEPAHGLLFANHEYTNEELMFPGLGRQDRAGFKDMTPALAAIEMAAHGASILEVRREAGRWRVVPGSRYARRITTRSTRMRLAGPAAGDPLLRTAADPSGRLVVGTVNNCAGGVTPWGTVLTAEENFYGYFWSAQETPAAGPRLQRYGVPGRWYDWGRHEPRFDVDREPNEANRFGWIVEVDPYDPASMPVKRTALGRFVHEGADVTLAPDGRVVVYSGDDARFEYVYRFVSAGRYVPGERAANRRLLDAGTLSVARFEVDGTLTWLPLVWGRGPLTAANGFASQADVLVHARAAADAVGATPMDRPEDIETSPVTGRIYLCLSNNVLREPAQVDAANPRARNIFGHVIEISPAGGDHAAETATWDILVRCGDPRDAEADARFHPQTSANGWFASPDNVALDALGRLWVATDQGERWARSGTADGLWGLETEGPLRGLGRMFLRVPVGAELCGPVFTPDATTLFAAVQHPAADGAKAYSPFGRESTYEDPATRWPDFDPAMPPRPAVLAITRPGGGRIGG